MKLKAVLLSLLVQHFGRAEVYESKCKGTNDALCPDGTCQRNYSYCSGFEGCTSTKRPYLCSDGKCASSFATCTTKFFQCERQEGGKGESKCADGRCRKDCTKLRSSACPFDTPLRCSDGRCVTMLTECASVRCEADRPFLCPDNRCVDVLTHCRFPLSGRVMQKMDRVETAPQVQVVDINSVNGETLGRFEFHEHLTLTMEGFTLSQLARTSIAYEPKYRPVFEDFFSLPPQNLTANQLVRSAAVRFGPPGESSIDSRPASLIRIFLYFDQMQTVERYKDLPPYVS